MLSFLISFGFFFFSLALFQAKVEDAALRRIQRENKARFVIPSLHHGRVVTLILVKTMCKRFFL